ncbi:AAA family ATPase [Lentzea alba]|uniref:AAA family ATPase n=1 Tax=Lentzea alba TaxID=2714351 RepID=UPI0039BFA841
MPDRLDGRAYVLPDNLKLAVEVAYATERPLLLRGHPGSGKSSLAAHVAWLKSARYYELTVTSRTQAQDLLWSFDTVRRLADAQLRERRDDHAYVEPGVLWWALDRDSAFRRGADTDLPSAVEPNAELNADRSPAHAVVLIDEIDKADPDLPNGLLAPFGSNHFTVTETGVVVQVGDSPSTPGESRHLIVVTTNEERELPQAFLRRCVVVWLEHPNVDGLVDIARKHLNTYENGMTADEETLARALATAVVQAREDKQNRPPSTAEFLDALTACRKLGISTTSPAWRELHDMALIKQPRPS